MRGRGGVIITVVPPVKWLGFDITSATWEPLANIPDQFIQQYRERVHQES